MKVSLKYPQSALVSTLVVVALIISTDVALASSGNPGVFPPGSHPYGRTYGEWSAQWWQDAVRVTTLAGCPMASAGPHNQVWLLAGTTGGSATRSCTVPTGKAILFPIINAECSTAEGNGTTEQQLRDCARALMDQVTVVAATVDGASLHGLTPPNSPYRVESPLFNFDALSGNPFGIPTGTTPSVSDGYWIMLHPLPPGVHTIHFHAEAPSLITTDTTYTLVVKPGQ